MTRRIRQVFTVGLLALVASALAAEPPSSPADAPSVEDFFRKSLPGMWNDSSAFSPVTLHWRRQSLFAGSRSRGAQNCGESESGS